MKFALGVLVGVFGCIYFSSYKDSVQEKIWENESRYHFGQWLFNYWKDDPEMKSRYGMAYIIKKMPVSVAF